MGRGKKNIFYKRINILYRPVFWNKFLKKHPEYEDVDIKELKKLAYDFFDTCGDLLVNQPNGIVIDSIGYFSNAVYNISNVRKLNHTTHINLISDGRIYKSTFFPRIFKYIPLYNWSFKIAERRKHDMAEKIRGGMKYLCHYNLLKKQKNNGRNYFLRRVFK